MATAGWVSIGGGLLLAALAGVLLHRTRSVRSER
jgi:MYXO-CTERM domain-containing protein